MLRPRLILLLCLLVACPLAAARADEAPHARAYLQTLQSTLDQMRRQMPQFTHAAEQAAVPLAAGRGFGVRGDRGLAFELSNRAGAMMGYDGRPGEQGDVILFVFGLEQTDQNSHAQLLRQINDMQQLNNAGSTVIALGSKQKIQNLNLTDALLNACHALIDNHAPTTSSPDAPIEPVLNTAAAWVFQCELFATLTRHDKLPVVRQSFETDTLKKRWRRYGSQPFHHDRWLDPVAPGTLGRAYIDNLQSVLTDIGTASWKNLAATAIRAANTLNNDGKVWLRAGGRALPYHVGAKLTHDPNLFTLLTHDGSNQSLPTPGKNDYLIAVGRNETAGSYEWGEPELLRKAGHGVAWVVNGYNTQRHDLKRNERLIDLWGPVGDCVVRDQHYDTPLAPVGSATAEAVTWMLAAEISSRIQQEVSTDFADDTD